MLLQCDAGEIQLLPALPSAWPTGRVTGLRARGGFEIDLSWKDGAVERATVRSLRGGPLRLRRGETLPGRGQHHAGRRAGLHRGEPPALDYVGTTPASVR